MKIVDQHSIFSPRNIMVRVETQDELNSLSKFVNTKVSTLAPNVYEGLNEKTLNNLGVSFTHGGIKRAFYWGRRELTETGYQKESARINTILRKYPNNEALQLSGNARLAKFKWDLKNINN